MSDIVPQFHRAARPENIPDGHGYLASTVVPGADVTILSDANHRSSATKYDDLFGGEKLGDFHEAGVTDVFIEIPGMMQPMMDKLAAGELTVEEFVEGTNLFRARSLSEEGGLEMRRNLGEAIVNGASMNPPVKFHAASINFTQEQYAELSELRDTVRVYEDEARTRVDSFIDEYGEQLGAENSLELSSLVGRHFDPFNRNDPLQMFRDMREFLPDSIPAEARDELTRGLLLLRGEQIDAQRKYGETLRGFRIDNDKILAEDIQSKRDPNGKAIVVHGAGHGAHRDEALGGDLDEHLQQAGVNVSRVNLAYSAVDMGYVGTLPDAADINYWPEKNLIEFKDHNKDGLVNGAPKVSQGNEPVDQTPSSPDMPMGDTPAVTDPGLPGMRR